MIPITAEELQSKELALRKEAYNAIIYHLNKRDGSRLNFTSVYPVVQFTDPDSNNRQVVSYRIEEVFVSRILRVDELHLRVFSQDGYRTRATWGENELNNISFDELRLLLKEIAIAN